MQFDSFSAFLAMGGYGFYVWLSFGVSSALILALIVNSTQGHKQIIKNIALRQQREAKLRQVRKQKSRPNNIQNNPSNEVSP
ncbi:heme exporter protein CcmD [Colwellia sp. KU-HH00111]|uniref:heme exporter protein CcmD n=1 Tax=Colwellia sp. KU-HH00111 TaxID=3127652 RepID=UPI00310796F9